METATAGDQALTVISLNLAHGRGESFNQLFVSTPSIRANLDRIARLLRREQPDIVALQEADGPSRWSGGFDHVAYLAEQAGYPAQMRGSHARSWLFDYGTALLSKRPFLSSRSEAFAPTPPTARKGYVLAQLRWPGNGPPIDIVSVHLDFSRDSVRQAQVDALLRELASRKHPIILAGDFNSSSLDPGSPLRRLIDEAGLQAWRPNAPDLGSYKDGRKRLDWILISSELRFDAYRVLADIVSDHRAVVAMISLRED